MIEIKAAGKTFRSGERNTIALGQVDLAIDDGEFVSFIGPSGCGKSTLLNMIAGIIAPSMGSILRVECPEWFVHQQRGRVVAENLRQRNALLHAP